ncbi:MAG: hypothetical protein AMJ88_11205 [Anaerolineae bacterium SM23_ 63]|nr:MAG: hypothetical protein AMJ88_11205 [Anaerolineae bacterium SM23_ 63]
MWSYTERSVGQVNIVPTHRNAGADADTLLDSAVADVEQCVEIVGMCRWSKIPVSALAIGHIGYV